MLTAATVEPSSRQPTSRGGHGIIRPAILMPELDRHLRKTFFHPVEWNGYDFKHTGKLPEVDSPSESTSGFQKVKR